MKPTPEPAIETLKQHGRSFYFASQFLDPRYRNRAARLYAFCRHIDDLADESDDSAVAQAELAHIKTQLATAQGQDPHTLDMLSLMRDTAMPASPVMSLIEGVESDLQGLEIHSEADLINYAYSVAGTVGLMMSIVLDVHDENAWPFAIDLGIAMQLTNIARDIGEDASKNRVYLPTAWVGELDPQKIRHPDTQLQQTLRTNTKRILDLAEHYYRSGLSGLHYLPKQARTAILVAAQVYREIGQLIRRSGYSTWDRRTVVSLPRKLACATGTLTRYLLIDRKNQTSLHNLDLHAALTDRFGAHKQTTHE